MAIVVPFSLENQTGSSIVLRDNTILDGETYEMPLKETFYNDFNAGVFNRDFTGITIIGTDNNVMSREVFWGVFNTLQNSDIINIDTEGINSLGEGIPTSVSDEEDRYSKFPNPVDGLTIYNERLNTIEKFYSTLGLWLNSHLVVVSNSNTLEEARIVYVNGDEVVDSVEYPLVFYPTNSIERSEARGVLIESNSTTGLATLAVSGQYFVEVGETISTNEYIRAKTGGTNADIGKAQGLSGGSNGQIGWATQNSGATPGKTDFVLVNIHPEWR
jgi:hypothetical protein